MIALGTTEDSPCGTLNILYLSRRLMRLTNQLSWRQEVSAAFIDPVATATSYIDIKRYLALPLFLRLKRDGDHEIEPGLTVTILASMSGSISAESNGGSLVAPPADGAATAQEADEENDEEIEAAPMIATVDSMGLRESAFG